MTHDDAVRVVDHYRNRFNANDAEGLAAVYATDITFVNLGGETFVGRGAVRDQQARGFRGPLQHTTIELAVQSTAALGDDHVLVLIRQTIATADPAVRSSGAATTTMILDRTSGSWLIQHLQSTPLGVA